MCCSIYLPIYAWFPDHITFYIHTWEACCLFLSTTVFCGENPALLAAQGGKANCSGCALEGLYVEYLHTYSELV
jgi:hypothetical protein